MMMIKDDQNHHYGTTLLLPSIKKKSNPSSHRYPYLTLPMKRTGSWGMMDILDLKSKRPRTDMSTSSIVIDPLSASTRRNRATLKDDFPVRYGISKIIQIGVINPSTNLNRHTSRTIHTIERLWLKTWDRGDCSIHRGACCWGRQVLCLQISNHWMHCLLWLGRTWSPFRGTKLHQSWSYALSKWHPLGFEPVTLRLRDICFTTGLLLHRLDFELVTKPLLYTRATFIESNVLPTHELPVTRPLVVLPLSYY